MSKADFEFTTLKTVETLTSQQTKTLKTIIYIILDNLVGFFVCFLFLFCFFQKKNLLKLHSLIS